MIDAHCHLNFHSFENDLDEVVARATKAGVTTIVNVGTSIPSSKKAIELAHQYSNMFAIVGIHPHHADKLVPSLQSSASPAVLKEDKEFENEIQSDWLEKLRGFADDEKVIAIGEVGLDYFKYKSNGVVDKQLQFDAFEKQIELSIDLGLPLQIHNRLAGEDVIKVLSKYKGRLQNPPGMFHCFAGTKEVLKDALDLGFYIGYDGNITYKGIAPGETVALSELAKLTPLDRIMTETDSPFLTPVPLRGSRNEPKNVIIVQEYIANLKGVPFKELEEATTSNFRKLFL